MKRLILGVLIALPVAAKPPLNWRSRTAPVGRYDTVIKENISSPNLRIAVGALAFYIAATDNPIRREFLKRVDSIQKYFNRIKEAERKTQILARNMRTMHKTFMALA